MGWQGARTRPTRLVSTTSFMLPGAVVLNPMTPRLSSVRSAVPRMYDEGFFHELMQRKVGAYVSFLKS